MNLKLQILGTDVPYSDALELQQELVSQRLAGDIPDTLLLLEHAPVYTIGRTRDQSSLQNPEKLPHTVHEISRGGQATYHGPGQLVGYPIVDLNPLGKDLHNYLRAIENSLENFCRHFRVPAIQREGLTGIWVEDRKLASIGVGVRKWITYHGFALNLRPESLGPFEAITPCGLSGVSMTCLTKEGAPSLDLQDCARHYPAFLEKELASLT
ncbi:lipoyl(octanoyl) transferase LipB [Roseibacillus persicicus]|uniref:lipoyl(octanoyl) transferase LipB n=1 Tax=Roseibacillus persicicus TaxID=454148 RepID=UPI00280CFDAA|nr:lipoyl(octanoyl) transferase LipB [Roseibacillus persicicus]MDQ8189651.1 lipoyl(octanoyl) transferase LipB [Roseibacillus persicicus]